jgi:[protein-PII] uridylyltransferase
VHVELRPGSSQRLYHAVVIAPDRRGLLSKAAGVLKLNSLRVHSASVNIHEGAAINEFVVSPHFGSPPAAALLRQQLIGALSGELDVLGMLEKQNATAAPKPVGEAPTAIPVHQQTAPPRIQWLDGTPGQPIIQIRATDRIGLLALLTAELERAGVDIDWAKVTTVGSMVDDVFGVTLPAESADTDSTGLPESSLRADIEQHLLAALDATGDTADV